MSTVTDDTATPSPDGRPDWWIYRGTGEPIDRDLTELLPGPPPWRTFDGEPVLASPPSIEAEVRRRIGTRTVPHRPDPHEVEMVNAAIYLRRPLLVTGAPGTGKSSLAYRIAHELRLGPVLRWPITTRTTLAHGLYQYDAIGRVQAANLSGAEEADIGDFVRLGPLGTALLPFDKPRVL